jgi:adenylate cyclase
MLADTRPPVPANPGNPAFYCTHQLNRIRSLKPPRVGHTTPPPSAESPLMPAVVFADVVGSTDLFEQMGDATASLLMTRLTGVLGTVFEQHQGRVVKLLGDGVFAVFPDASSAITACVTLQSRFLADPVIPIGRTAPIQMQMGVESGELVEIEGDCFGDAVNSAARLADLAGADQILTTQSVWNELASGQRPSLRSLGPMHLRGKAQTTHIYRVEWQTGRDLDATAMGVSMYAPAKHQTLALTLLGRTQVFEVTDTGITIGRSADASLPVLDTRVSRVHATIRSRGGQMVLADASSFGTWVYFGNQAEAVSLRRTECILVGYGQLSLGCEIDSDKAPLIAFEVS